MSKKAFFLLDCQNIAVTRDYLEVIAAALSSLGYEAEWVESLDRVKKSELVVFLRGKDAFRFFFKGYKNFIFWQQGATGDESFMRHGSRLRRKILDLMDIFSMKKAKMIFYVSEYMRSYYEKKAGTAFDKKSYIMPCFNEQLDRSVLDLKDYSRKIFTYVGSLGPWQCFEETADVYAAIEKVIPDAFFRVLTFDTDKAKKILSEKGIKNYSVKSVPKEDVKGELEGATFGFVLRRDNEVNRVATPTKLSSYLAAGVLPIYSRCLVDFAARAADRSFAFPMDVGDDSSALLDFVTGEIDVEHVKRVKEEIIELFDSYYSAKTHAENIAALAKTLI